MPAKYDRYIEVVGGGGWVLFGKEPDKGVMEVFNDYNADLINLYRCVKNRTWELLQVLGFLPLNSRDEFMEIKSFLEMGQLRLPYDRHHLSGFIWYSGIVSRPSEKTDGNGRKIPA